MENCIKVNKSNLLTIIIPTYNRDELLDLSLSQLKVLRDYFEFDVIVCDNASEDKTKAIVEKWERQLSLLYLRHDKNIFYDRNVTSGYLEVKTPYCWVLGDSYTVNYDGMNRIWTILTEEAPQALILNRANKIKFGEKVYSNARTLFRELGWYVTLLCSCIISKDFISIQRCKRYYDTWFLHEGIFFEYLATAEKVNVHFLPDINIDENQIGGKASNSWRRTPFSVFGKGWFSFIMSLPNQYSLEDKLYCIKQHDVNQHFYSPKEYLKLKLMGYMTFEDYLYSRPYLKYVVNTPLFFFDIIYLIPSMPKIYSLLRRIKRKVKI